MPGLIIIGVFFSPVGNGFGINGKSRFLRTGIFCKSSGARQYILSGARENTFPLSLEK
ncbi:MAG: hypothetical protein WAU24_06755 [Chitinophagaceae bacterium]